MQKEKDPHHHHIFMQRCLELAVKGLGRVAPNPMVGSVVVHKNTIIGEGFHQQYGQAHAEVNAIRNVKDESLLLESTLYVNLEPCAHSGKTPPCTDLILEKKIPRVVIGTSDPNSLVAGKGIEKLKKNGVEVITGIMDDSCFELNRRFFTFHEKQRPYIILKWAQTRDGFIDIIRQPGTPIGINWITTELSRTLVHRWRSEEQGILVGKKTVLFDDPALNVRDWEGQNPTRIVLDRNLELPLDRKVFDGSIDTLVYNNRKNSTEGKTAYIKLDFTLENLQLVLDDLYQRQISSVIVEGGKQVLEHFIQEKLWDEARVFIGNKEFKEGIKAPVLEELPISEENLLEDRLLVFRR